MSDKAIYSVKELADMAGVSTRTLRYYDQIGLLVPRRAENGYRTYDAEDVRALQYILLLRRCQVPLATICGALKDPDFEIGHMLVNHLNNLRRQRCDLEKTISIVQHAVEGLETFEAMDDTQRFEKLKQDSVERFEQEYGEESRALYGDDAIDAANERMLTMSKEAWDLKEELEQRIKDTLREAMTTRDIHSSLSKMVAQMHAQWIRIHWGEQAYSPQAHVSLAEGYLKDARFVDYYDSACGEGATEFLCEIVKANIS